jgi:hypothetical protein
MRQPQLFTSWTIACPSPEDCQALQRWLSGRIDRDRVMTDTIRTGPPGTQQSQDVRHRLSDHFADIRMVAAPTPSAFRLVFHRLPGGNRYWKDMMVNILQEIQASAPKASITLEYKGDDGARALGGGRGKGEAPDAAL